MVGLKFCFLETFFFDSAYLKTYIFFPAKKSFLITAADLGFNFRVCRKWKLGFGKHSEPPEVVLGAALEANAFRAICSLKLA